jgi:hypothetical protein
VTETISGHGSPYQDLLRAAQRLARTHDTKPAPASEGEPKLGPSATVYAVLAARLAAAESAETGDLVEVARRAVEAAAATRIAWKAELESLMTERGDFEKRRRELNAATQGYDWAIVHKEKEDFLGPFSLDHTPAKSRILLGRTKLLVLDYPAGQEVFEAVKSERKRLEAAARELWPTMKERLLPLQSALDSTITWPQVVAALTDPDVPFKKREPAVLYTLSLLRAGQLEPNWSLSTLPPALAQQRDSVVLPRIDKPGSPDKVFALRLEPEQTGPVLE